MFSQKNRVPRTLIPQIISGGKFFNLKNKDFSIKFAPNTLGERRFAVIVSKKNSKTSVGRHKLKRSIIDIVKQEAENLPPSSDFVIFAKPDKK